MEDKVYNTLSKRMISVKSPKVKTLLSQGFYIENGKLLAPVPTQRLPDDLLMNDIIDSMTNPDFFKLCKTNKRFYQACQHDSFWKKMVDKFYPFSGLDIKDFDSYKSLFKTCYYISILIKTDPNSTIVSYYKSKGLGITNPTNVHYKAIKYMPFLETLEISSNHLFPLPQDVYQYPRLKKIIQTKI